MSCTKEKNICVIIACSSQHNTCNNLISTRTDWNHLTRTDVTVIVLDLYVTATTSYIIYLFCNRSFRFIFVVQSLHFSLFLDKINMCMCVTTARFVVSTAENKKNSKRDMETEKKNAFKYVCTLLLSFWASIFEWTLNRRRYNKGMII